MKAVVLGIDYSNLGSLGMLNVVKRNFCGKVFEICHVSPAALGLESGENSEAIAIRLRTYLKALASPKAFWRVVLSSDEQRKLAVFSEADIVFDISGFALSSKFPVLSNLRYLAPVFLAQRLGKPVVLLPQSFGPFTYPWRWLFMAVVRHVLKRTEQTFARDENSLLYLHNEGVQAVRGFDLVFIYDEMGPSQIEFDRGNLCVGIIPNVHLLELIPENQIISLYVELMKGLHERGFVPVVFSHTIAERPGNDLELIRRLKNKCGELGTLKASEFVFMDRAMKIEEVNSLFARFHFVVASRFHCLVLNYNKCKPAILFGWANKYGELARDLAQEHYVVNAAEGVSAGTLLSKVDRLLQNYETEVNAIDLRLRNLRNKCRDALARYLPVWDACQESERAYNRSRNQ